MGLSRLAALHGVATSHSPSPGVTVPVPDDTVTAVLAALGVAATTPADVRKSLAAAESRAGSRLLPQTVVVWEGDPLPAALATLPIGTTLDVAPEAEPGAPGPNRSGSASPARRRTSRTPRPRPASPSGGRPRRSACTG